MQPREDQSPNNSRSLNLRRNLKQFFFQTVGGRTYLRLMRLVLILVIGLTIVSLVSIIILFAVRSKPHDSVPVNVNITLPPSAPYTPDKPIIRKVKPQPSPPKIGQQPNSTPVPPTILMPDNNGNEQLTPKPPQRSSPSESPP